MGALRSSKTDSNHLMEPRPASAHNSSVQQSYQCRRMLTSVAVPAKVANLDQQSNSNLRGPSQTNTSSPSTNYQPDEKSVLRKQMESEVSSVVTVREEEIVIVAIILALWLAIIAVFINKWGKIRMLEPYQPRYVSEPFDGRTSRLNMSEAFSTDLPRFSLLDVCLEETGRPRQNSVFVQSPFSRTNLVAGFTTPRKAKSAEDIKTLVVKLAQHHMGGSAV